MPIERKVAGSSPSTSLYFSSILLHFGDQCGEQAIVAIIIVEKTKFVTVRMCILWFSVTTWLKLVIIIKTLLRFSREKCHLGPCIFSVLAND